MTNGTVMAMPGTIGSAKILYRIMPQASIGIIGLGFVGNAVRQSYSHLDYTVRCMDTDPSKHASATYEDIKATEAVFICVPSPMNEDGSCNTDILESVLSNLKGYNGVIISKVTAPPDVYQRLQDSYPNLVHSPEFLTATNAVNDYVNGKFCIIGGAVKAYMNEAARIIKLGQTSLEDVVLCTIGEAALAKYTINSFLATKVVFMNEMFKLSQKLNLDWNTVRELIELDKTRIGKSHDRVPGPDGSFGFGGACFPKDTSAILKVAEQYGIDMMVLDSAVKKNTLLRLSGE